MTTDSDTPMVGVIMGSASDWDTMRHCRDTLRDFDVPVEARVLSAHRTPAEACEYVSTAADRGIRVIIAAAGGAAHLAGVAAAHTTLPVLGVPMEGWALQGLDALLATVQMPKGIPVGTLAIGKHGAINSALLAIAIIANEQPELRTKLEAYREEQRRQILETELP